MITKLYICDDNNAFKQTYYKTRMKKIFIIGFALIFMLGIFVFATPGIPHTFSGTVEYSGNPNMNLQGDDVCASINGFGLGKIGKVGENNKYGDGLDVAIIPKEHRGEITFYIGNVSANPTAEYEEGGDTELNLTINEIPTGSCGGSCGNEIFEEWEQCDGFVPQGITCAVIMGSGWTGIISCSGSCTYDTSECIPPALYCGDGVCNNGESCSSCSQDCGSCSEGGNGGSCFPAGTKITMKDKSEKNIEDVKVGDYVLSYDFKNQKKSFAKVIELESPIREHMCEIVFEDNSNLKLTREHPVYTKQGWKSINPFETSIENSELGFVSKLKTTDEVLFADSEYKKIEKINCWSEIVQTYNLKKVGFYNNFYADGVLVHNKGGGSSPNNPPSSSNNNVVNLNTETEIEENKTVDLNLDENQNKKSSGITGAVIGFAKSGVGIGLIFAILIVIAGIIVVGFRNKTKQIQ